MSLGDGVFEFDHVRSARVRVGESGELEHGGNVRLILGANLAHMFVRAEIIFAIGKLQSALQKIRGVMVRIVEAGSDPKSEQVGSMKVCVVQRIDIGAKCFT